MIVKKIPILQGFRDFALIKKLSFSDQSTSVFLDIETNGLSSRQSFIYLIGILKIIEEEPVLIQWFAEAPEEEKDILVSFFQAAKGCTGLIHFNGIQFDLPFIQARCAAHGLDFPLAGLPSLDLCRELKKLQPLLKLPSRKFKTVEDFLGLSRKNDVNGKDCIHLYQKFYASGKEEFLAPILLHNQLDLTHLTELMRMLSYLQILTGDYHLEECIRVENSLVLILSVKMAFPRKISYASADAYLTADTHSIKIQLPLRDGKLKKYYTAYKEYYYLPEEDYAIHKSVGKYVDKPRRKAATRTNCYTWFSPSADFLSHEGTIEGYLKENLPPLLDLW